MSGAASAGREGVDPARHDDERFRRIWQPPGGLAAVSAVNQTIVGRRFIVTGFVFLVLGGVLALLMRLQLAVPESGLIDHQLFNELFTMHGTTMMFLFAVPMVEGVAVYLIPLMIGARDLVFPRLSAFGYWCYLFGGILLYSSFFVGAAPDAGWFMYTPLSGREFSPLPNIDFWLLGVTFAEVSAITAAIELTVTILKARAPGMSINRMPLFAWYMLVVALMIIFAFPALILGSLLLEVERAFGWPFYDPSLGGDSLLWQHYFWIFGHPEVYIIFLPGAGMIATIIPTFARRPMAGHVWVVLAVIGTGFVSMGLWVHHMFTTGMPLLTMGFFSSASMTVSVLTGIQIFAFLATLWLGRPVLRTPLLFTAGFLVIFVLGGLTGVMVAVVPFDWQVHDTYFVVAHFHYVLIGGMVFPLFAALYYWAPNFTGRMLGERLGRWNFWTMFIGFNLAFFPMHIVGLLGMPRRVYTYPEGLGWELPNLIATAGAFVFALGVLLFAYNFWRCLRSGEPAGHNPWNAGTLEWATDVPVPAYNFRSVPTIDSAYPLWDQPGLFEDISRGRGLLADPASNLRLTPGSTPTQGELDQVIVLPKPTYLPLIAASTIAAFLIAFLVKQYGIAAVLLGATVAVFLAWGWKDPIREREAPVEEARTHGVKVGAEGPRAPGWWGLVFALIVDALLWVSLAFGFLFLWSRNESWPPSGFGAPDWAMAGLALVLLVLSSAGPFVARRAIARSDGHRVSAVGLAATAAAGTLSAVLIGMVLGALPFGPSEHAFAALFHALAAFLLLHVGIGVILLLFTLARVLAMRESEPPTLTLQITSLYWHYVVVLTVATAALVYFLPGWPAQGAA